MRLIIYDHSNVIIWDTETILKSKTADPVNLQHMTRARAGGRSGRTELPALSQDNEKHQVATALCTCVHVLHVYTSNSTEKVALLPCVCVCVYILLIFLCTLANIKIIIIEMVVHNEKYQVRSHDSLYKRKNTMSLNFMERAALFPSF